MHAPIENNYYSVKHHHSHFGVGIISFSFPFFFISASLAFLPMVVYVLSQVGSTLVSPHKKILFLKNHLAHGALAAALDPPAVELPD